MVSDENKFKEFINFCGIDYKKINFDLMKKPHNVHVPKSFNLDKKQNKLFWDISSNAMKNYGYDLKADYRVNY